MKKITQILTVVIFMLIIVVLPIVHFLLEDKQISVSERKELEQFPIVNAENILSGKFSKDIEEYMLDQFPARDSLRYLNTLIDKYAFGHIDVNGYYMHNGFISKRGEKPKQKQIDYAIKHLNGIIEKYLGDSNCYFAIIPDKEVYAGLETGFDFTNYEKIEKLMLEGLENVQYIPLFDKLELSDYYYTDTHWRQEKITDVAQYIINQIDKDIVLSDEYTQNVLSGYYGVLSDQSAFKTKSEDMIYLTNDVLDKIYMTSPEFEGQKAVYQTQLFEAEGDPYDLFADGAKSILTLHNPSVDNNKELIVFRDSFGSSIAPLFAQGYSKVTLIDLRYVSSQIMDNFVDFNGQDVLFLYSSSLINSAMLLK